MIQESFLVSEKEANQRLDAVLVHRYPEYSRAHLQKMVKSARVLVQGASVKTGYKLRETEVVKVQIDDLTEMVAKAEDLLLDILHEDEHLLCVNKPAPMVLYPSPGYAEGVLVNAVLNYFPDLPCVDGPERPGIVHRLDKDTSGCILFSKEVKVHEALQGLFKNREVRKHYIALCHGSPKDGEGEIEIPLARSIRDWNSMRVSLTGKQALTRYKVRKESDSLSWIDAYPHTGRMHQIRVHLREIGCPIIADPVYGHEKVFYLSSKGKHHTKAEFPLLTRHALHAADITFPHPITGKELRVEAPLPEDLTNAVTALQLG